MKLIGVITLAISLLATSLSYAATTETISEQDHSPVSEGLSYTDAVILGLVEGLTEYLPVSSTGHLIIANALLGLDGDTPMADKNGAPILVKADDGSMQAYTIGDAAYAYVIVIQAGAIVAVVLLYWRTILTLILGCLGKDSKGLKLAINLTAAFLPAAVIGLLLNDLIESLLGDNIFAVAGALIVGAFVMLGVERWRHHGNKGAVPAEDGPGLSELTVGKSVMIGFFQCFAMWPGTSRSMATIVGGYIAGLSPAHAAEFSFLLGLITLSAASAYKFLTDGSEMLAALNIGPVLVGCIVAFISAALAVKWLVGYLSKHGLALFAWYRIALAIAIFALMK
ncbi:MULTISPECIES: undecaprenyl-diphosphate phosphatase [unclassified Lentimonas]|uniref:undecaprenyl-diphosphate phosphatase n=1 Tax=unclassified Lentimonas TaxID=2630993 RepID=UPI0013228A94|nr:MULTISPECIES: undecaprenyl-diphosphate phosphatase [unclassified Lentimonas]CAA6676829.1 Undecaprenyl-diphosphatase (EC [Lentimonas sp. CC4]CAA6686636.1 Undecaprenyl-diphosphatase (EC [Lentimonas sp. CC6]CAA6693022.1 Undecaprenyl-diphosphatase (EC [Lentimonas sp. CC10]CAA6695721.1 Undecaprenyl-diphosphatase (EC [Lentimonas sp. CC19]CAA7070012.1 Undecaprenyl-diphosphatase (EC [Lentimonas sp. CC11]